MSDLDDDRILEAALERDAQEFYEESVAKRNGHARKVRVDDDADWRERLVTRTKIVKGETFETVLPNAANVATILRYHPKWRGVIAYDAFTEAIVTTSAPPWHPIDAPETVEPGAWLDVDTGRVIGWLSREEDFETHPKIVEQALAVVAHANVVHPVKDYLRALKWDGKQRLPSMLSAYFGAEETEYSAAIGARWMISAVARIFEPGCQADCTLVLEGRQGIGKSRSLRTLVGQRWYSETGITIGDKDSYQVLRGLWIYLFDELDSLKRGELTRVKNFLTSPKDRYRPSFGLRARDFLRQTVFAGTTNELEYLIDKSGNRRFWPVAIVREPDHHAIARDRDQLWAEARSRYESGEPWHVDTPALRRLCEAEQERRVQQDPWLIFVARWLAKPKVVEWDEVAGRMLERRYDIAGGVLIADVLLYAIQKPRGQITRPDEMRIGDCLRELGFTRQRRRVDGSREYRFFPSPTSEVSASLPVPSTIAKGEDDDSP